MATERRHLDEHVREQRETHQDLVKPRIVFDVEDAHVLILAHDPPDVPPDAQLHEFLAASLFPGLEIVDLGLVRVLRDADVHRDVKQHGSARHGFGERHRLCRPIAAVRRDDFLIKLDAETRPGWNHQREVAVFERRCEQLLCQK